MSIDYKLIGSRIKTKRKMTLLTQEKMAELLNVSVGYVSQVERGYAKPNLEMLASISKILDCDISELVSNIIVEKNIFLNNELNLILYSMNSRQKQIMLDIAEIIKNY